MDEYRGFIDRMNKLMELKVIYGSAVDCIAKTLESDTSDSEKLDAIRFFIKYAKEEVGKTK